jgi:hypothetical protein
MRYRKTTLIAGMVCLAISLTGAHVFAYGEKEYAVTITNLTRGQSFTPILVVNHHHGLTLFAAGSPASEELAALAESGNIEPLQTLLDESSAVNDTQASEGLLDPGHSTTVIVKAKRNFRRVSVAAMLIPTNDAFFSIQNIRIPRGWHKKTVYAPAYDAGSETNDELCSNIPGPVCGGAGPSPEDQGEGYVHIHAGIDGGIGDLQPLTESRDWRNPVTKITIQRVQ